MIVGTRRHWSISWLRRNSYPTMQFLAQAATLDDEAAFRLADLENRARRDISDIERCAQLYHCTRPALRRQTETHGRAVACLRGLAFQDAARRNPSPISVLSAFASLTDVQLKPAYALARALDDHAATQAILGAAQILGSEQTAARGERPARRIGGPMSCAGC